MKRTNETKRKNEIDGIQNRIQKFKISFGLLQNSVAFSFKRKVRGKRKVRKKEESKGRRKNYTAHKRNSELV